MGLVVGNSYCHVVHISLPEEGGDVGARVEVPPGVELLGGAADLLVHLGHAALHPRINRLA